jgi:hypothetical protein
MTKIEVEAILGKGHMINPGFLGSPEKVTWSGRTFSLGPASSHANFAVSISVDFQGGRVVGKGQNGL